MTCSSLTEKIEEALEAGKTYDCYMLQIVDRAGQEIGEGVNNAKGVIVAAYVMAGFGEAFNENTAARDVLVDDLWNLMNPPTEYVESEVCYCSGCQMGEGETTSCPGHQDVAITIRVLFLADLQAL